MSLRKLLQAVHDRVKVHSAMRWPVSEESTVAPNCPENYGALFWFLYGLVIGQTTDDQLIALAAYRCQTVASQVSQNSKIPSWDKVLMHLEESVSRCP